MKRIAIISIIMLFFLGKTNSQGVSAPYMYVNQIQQGTNTKVINNTKTSPAGNSSSPTPLDFGGEFTVVLEVPTGTYTGKTLFLFMQDWQSGTGATNGGNFQTTPVNQPSLRFTQSTSDDPSLDKYELTIAAGAYPTLMNSTNKWNSLPDGTILRPTFYFGYTDSPTTPSVWQQFVINPIDVWGYKNKLTIAPPNPNTTITIEINQYDLIEKNLEEMLLEGVQTPGGTFTLPSNTYTWYMSDQYGVSPYTYTVNNPNLWLNNVYQPGFKPWINSIHVDMSNPDFVSLNSQNEDCYTLYYYVIPSSQVPEVRAPNGSNYRGGYVNPTTFNQQAYKVVIKIKPVATPPIIANPLTIASQDYGSDTAGTQWGPQLPTTETGYTYAGQYLPDNGAYSLSQDIMGRIAPPNNSRPMDWYVPPGGANAPAKKYDHTSGDGTGFMYIVNASTAGGIFYRNTFDVCPGMNLQFSMWLSNICDGTRDNNAYFFQYRIKPNIRIQIWDGEFTTPPSSGTPLLDYYTGEIPMTGEWEQYFTPLFTVPSSTNKISVFYLSVNNGGQGNDFMMDDIQIQRSNGTFEFSREDTQPCLSAEDPYQIDANWNADMIREIYGDTPPASFEYKWTFYSLANSGTETDPEIEQGSSPITGTATYSEQNPTSISIIVPGSQIGTYKLTIATSQEGLSDICAISSSYIFSPIQMPVIKDPEGGSTAPICPGTTINLEIDTTSCNIPDVSKLEWYTVADDNTLTPLLDANGNQVTGIKASVVPVETTKYAVKIGDCIAQVEYQVTVETGPQINFGEGAGIADNYTFRTCYTSNQVNIPISYGRGNGNISYTVYQDSVTTPVRLTGGALSPNTTETLSFDLNSIKPSLENFRKGINTVTCAIIMRDFDTSCGSVQKFSIRFISDKAVWVPALNTSTPEDNTNWNNDANWYITDEFDNRYAQAGVPMACTDVIIPADAPNYPILKAATDYNSNDNLTTDDGFNPQPMCNSISFKYGGEVSQLQHLEYIYAYVEMNFGTFDNNEIFTNTGNIINTDGGRNYYQFHLDRNRYYSMSAPLKEMYSGDFAFGGKPVSYMKYADPIYIQQFNPEVSLLQKWSNSINSYNVPFPAGFGFAYQVLSGKAGFDTWPYEGNQDYLNNVNGIVKWPYYTNSEYLEKINPRHTYIASSEYGDGTSQISYFIKGYPMTDAGDTDILSRSSVTINNIVTGGSDIQVPKGNRFIVEEDGTNKFPTNNIITLTPTDNSSGQEILLGNPLMSHIDFSKLYLDNNGTVGTYCRLWSGSSAQYYSITLDETTGTPIANNDPLAENNDISSALISPLQSFFVPYTGNQGINLNMANVSVTFENKNNVLRSSENRPELLKIIASNSRYSAAVTIVNHLDKKELGAGVPKLFSPSGNIPEIYLLQDYKKEIIEINETVQSIPVGIKTKVTGGILTLTFHGLDDFSSKVSIYDAKTGITQTITARDNEFQFMNEEGDQENRFFLFFTPNDITGIDNLTNNYIHIYAMNGSIKASSVPSDPIQSVKIYSTQGQVILNENNLSTSLFQSNQINNKGVYIIEIKTTSNTSIKKITI